MSRHTSVRLTEAAVAALAYLRAHPYGFVLNREVSRYLVELALEQGWTPEGWTRTEEDNEETT